MSTDYRPGACNIGRAERRVRYGFGVASFLVAAALAVAVPVLSLPQWSLLATALPLFGGFIGYYQGRKAFCVRFALAGVYNVSDRLGTQQAVPDDEAARQDRRQARLLLARSAVSALVVAVAAYLLVPV